MKASVEFRTIEKQERQRAAQGSLSEAHKSKTKDPSLHEALTLLFSVSFRQTTTISRAPVNLYRDES